MSSMVERSEKAAGNGRSPYAFVVGCPRSGTTLLGRMLDSHPMLALADEPHFIPRAIRGTPVGEDPDLSPALVQAAREYHRFGRLGLSEEFVDAAAGRSRTYGAFVRALYDGFADSKGKPLAGEKAPYYVRYLPHLHTLFPWARFVHIIRDGREVALSLVHWAERKGKGPVARFAMARGEPVAVCALWWAGRVRAGRHDGAALGPTLYHEMRYEGLVGQAEETIRAITDFLGLAFDPQIMRFNEGKVQKDSKRSAKSAWLPPVKGLRDWRTDMSARDIELFEALAGDLLDELGYERAAPTISPAIAEIAERCRAQWAIERAGSMGRARSAEFAASSQADDD